MQVWPAIRIIRRPRPGGHARERRLDGTLDEQFLLTNDHDQARPARRYYASILRS
jgi:hypothetical protein